MLIRDRIKLFLLKFVKKVKFHQRSSKSSTHFSPVSFETQHRLNFAILLFTFTDNIKLRNNIAPNEKDKQTNFLVCFSREKVLHNWSFLFISFFRFFSCKFSIHSLLFFVLLLEGAPSFARINSSLNARQEKKKRDK